MTRRRYFIKQAVFASAALTVGGVLPGFSAQSYANIAGTNERIRIAAIGVNSRGTALATNFAKQEGCKVIYVCEVDSRAITQCVNSIEKAMGYLPKGEKDFRNILDSTEVDAVAIATPDHQHAPAALLAMKTGKKVYLEKPCSYTPAKGKILVKAAVKYNRTLQMGNQRCAWPKVREAKIKT